MSDIFQEVEEDVRRERYEQIWKNYGNYIMIAAALLVAGVAGYQAWRGYDLSQRQKMSDRFRAATQLAQTGNAPKAETDFATLVKDAPTGYATLAKFHLAAANLVQGKRDAGIAVLRDLTNSSDPLVSNAARLKLAWTMADASPKTEIASLLQPLTADDSAWRSAAQEVLAYIDLKDGGRGQALAEYQKLAADTGAPSSLRQRAAGIAEYLKANPDAGIAPPAPPSLSTLNLGATLPATSPAPANGAPAAQGTNPK